MKACHGYVTMEPCHRDVTMAVQEQPCHGDMAVQWQPHHGREPNRIRYAKAVADMMDARPYQRWYSHGCKGIRIHAGGAGAVPLAGSGNLLGCLGADICGAENAGLAETNVGIFGAW